MYMHVYYNVNANYCRRVALDCVARCRVTPVNLALRFV